MASISSRPRSGRKKQDSAKNWWLYHGGIFFLFVACGVGILVTSLRQPPRKVIRKFVGPKVEEKVDLREPPKPQTTAGLAASFLHRSRVAIHGHDRWTSEKYVVDFIAAEIIETMKKQPLLVVWLYDTTASASPMRAAVVEHVAEMCQTFDKLREAGQTPFTKANSEAFVNVVGSYDKSVKFLTDAPTADLAALRTANAGISGSGEAEEMTFSAISQAIEKFGAAATKERRRVIVVVVSDEIGDDAGQVDRTVELVQRNAVEVHVIGTPSPFGREGILLGNVITEGGRPVRSGPESLLVELPVLDALESPGVGSTVLESGFGPFALSRLCQESGGTYFPIRPEQPGIDLKLMSRYAPEYISRAAYDKLNAGNKARMALVQAAQLPPIDGSGSLTLSFFKEDEAALKRSLDAAQRLAARLEPKLKSLHQALALGESDRPKLEQRRWQASYDLSMGRVLAARARLEGYNSYLAQLKQGKKFDKPEHTIWVLTPSKTFKNESGLQKLADQAEMYLERVSQEHPGTPWAQLAWRDLSSPIGWEWKSE
jgi:hypothetical protein